MAGRRFAAAVVAGALIGVVGSAFAEAPSHPGFVDVAEEAGLTHIQREPLDERDVSLPEYISGGGAVGDFFGNGYQDLFLTRNDDTDILYKNMGDGTFEDRTEQVFGDQMVDAPTNGALMADLNNNGHLDIYVTTDGGTRHYLFTNDGYGHLVEEAAERGLMAQMRSHIPRNAGKSITAGDYTGDHHLDIFTSDWRSRAAHAQPPMPPRNRLYRNMRGGEPGHFEDVTKEAGLDSPNSQWGFTARFADMNKNGLMDLLVVNDYLNSEYYKNQGDGTFIEMASPMGTSTGSNEMGSSVADYNNNGWLDWFVTSIASRHHTRTDGNRLYRNEMHRGYEGLHFTDQTDSGVRDGYWGWGTSFIDYNNNGLRDIVMVNGYYLAGHQETPMKFWRNQGPEMNYVFEDIGEQIGLTDRGQGRGLIVADFFNNGQLDILVINYADRPVLYRNQGGPNGWLRIETVGETSHPMGIGAFITVQPDLDDDHFMVHDVNLGSNFLAHNETIAHFGLGRHEGAVDYIRIEWPSGVEQEFYDVEPNQQITVHEGEGIIDRSGSNPLAAGR